MLIISPLLALPLLVQGLPQAEQEAPQPGHGNGLKIGEVTATGAVLWTRLTQSAHALDRDLPWDPERPHWRVPGTPGEVRFVYWSEESERGETSWTEVDGSGDFSHQVAIGGLEPGTAYRVEAQGRVGADAASPSVFAGSFRTAPREDAADPVTLVISTCQEFRRRDDAENGHQIYRSMLALEPSFFVQAGDTLYYDRPKPFAKDVATARYKWNRFYALPYLRSFHSQVPSYWMHDDHDLLKDDCWPGQTYGDLTFERGLDLWREQIPQSARPYRTFRWGKHLQIWLPEGREYRSPNPTPDGPSKSILGEEQWQWLEASMRASNATYKLYVSATPVVGPDRKNKNDNHANDGFGQEGARLRAFLSSIPGATVINGDRHWQYHSIDPDTGLHEFGCGPASDSHAGGFRMDQRKEWQPFLRIAGGFVSVRVNGERAVLRHHDVSGAIVYSSPLVGAKEPPSRR